MKIKTTTKITIAEKSLAVNAKQVATMQLLGFTPEAIVGIRGLEGVRWSRTFGSEVYETRIPVYYSAFRSVTPAEALRRIVRASFCRCERDVMQRLRGPHLYSTLLP
jgi:hypothetical protein